MVQPEEYIEAARNVFGGAIDLDPASNDFANQVVKAKKFFTEKDDGLKRDWIGKVWLNPPYGSDEDGESNQKIWTQKAMYEYSKGNSFEIIMLIKAATSSVWFQPFWDYSICFPNRRIKFYQKEGVGPKPTHSSAIVYLGKNIRKFKKHFSALGVIVKKI